MGWVIGRNRSIQHKSGRRVDILGTCFGGNGLGRREKPIDSAQVRAPTLVAPCGPTSRRTQRVTGFMQELTSDGKSGGTQKVDFLGTCFGGAGLGLDSWAMISFMGTRVQHYGVHARDDVRW